MQQQKPLWITSLSKQQYSWENYSIENIIGGKTADNISYLKLFLTDYSKLFSTKVNPGCKNCLQSYLQKYKSKIYEMQNDCEYRLQARYNGIPLKFGSSTFINNSNITNEFAEKLMERYTKLYEAKGEVFNPSTIFEKYPVKIQALGEIEVISKLIKVRRTRKNKK